MFVYPRIIDFREDKEKKQWEIAKLLGTTQKQYSRWETGTTEIPAHHLITLARYYRVSLDRLMENAHPREET